MTSLYTRVIGLDLNPAVKCISLVIVCKTFMLLDVHVVVLVRIQCQNRRRTRVFLSMRSWYDKVILCIYKQWLLSPLNMVINNYIILRSWDHNKVNLYFLILLACRSQCRRLLLDFAFVVKVMLQFTTYWIMPANMTTFTNMIWRGGIKILMRVGMRN